MNSGWGPSSNVRQTELLGIASRVTNNRLGSVQDIDFDLADGSIVSVLTETDEVAGSRLLDLGSYAIVVHPT